MEDDILHNLADIGYNGPMLDGQKFLQELNVGAKSVEFTRLISWLANEIGEYTNIEERINATNSADDSSSFLLELSSFLKELGCVNDKLMTGNVNQRLIDKQDKLVLIDFLISELMAAKILQFNEPQDKSLEISVNESDTAKNLKDMLIALKFDKPPENITAEALFKRIITKLQAILKTVPQDLISKPLFFGELSNEQWQKLDQLQCELHEEYKIRREMLLKRLDVTITSFSWSERIQSKQDQLNKCFNPERIKLKIEPSVAISNVLASREDLAIIEKTSNAQVRRNTRSQVNKVIIGTVPDRGGRPYEQEPPPPEMPPWQKDRQGSGNQPQRGGFNRGRGGERGGGGGRARGDHHHQQNYSDRKDASANFGQNRNDSNQYNQGYNQGRNRGGHHSSTPGPVGVFLSSNYQGADYQGSTGGYQQVDQNNRGYYQHDNRGNYQDQGHQRNYQDQGHQRNYQDQGHQRNYHDHQGSSNYQDHRNDGHKGGGGHRGGRVQGGWNQGANRNSNYQRGGRGQRSDRY